MAAKQRRLLNKCLGVESVVICQFEGLPRPHGRQKEPLLLEGDLDGEVECVSPGLDPCPVLEVLLRNLLELILRLRLILQPGEEDLHDLVPVDLVLEESAGHLALHPSHELEVEVLTLHGEPKYGVRVLPQL